MNDIKIQEHSLLLEAFIKIWENETNANVLGDRKELERCIAWQVLHLSGAYERHSKAMEKLRNTK